MKLRTGILLTALGFSAMATTQAQTHKKATTKKYTLSKHSNPSNKESLDSVPLLSHQDSLSYILGLSLGSFLKQNHYNSLNARALNAAANAIINDKKTQIDDMTASRFMYTLQQQRAEEAQKEAAAKAGPERAKGEAFLAANKLKDSIKTLPDGLQYKIIKEGNGPKPKAEDDVKVNYVGMLIDGTEFDNSFKRGQPLDISVSGVIKGWTEILQLMPIGSTYQVFIPSELAYGDRGAGELIKPGATLIFNIQLMDINNKK